jgi:hypothetical protein
VDLSAYSSWYTDFIGYLIGISTDFDPVTGFPIGGLQVYRLAANSTQQVRTQGANVGVTYYRNKMTYGANYSYNELVTGEDDPIIPAFNTPRNKFNVSLTGHDMKLPFSGGKPHFGWGLAWRFIEGFTFEGSPQFTGAIPSYDMLDVQVNAKFPTRNLVVKLGCSNLFGFTPLVDPRVPSGERLERAWDNQVLMVFGGPNIGRLAYVQLIYELDRR